VIVEENCAEVNFELVERRAEREERDWIYFGRLRHEREKKRRDPRCIDRGRPAAAAASSRTQGHAETLIWDRAKSGGDYREANALLWLSSHQYPAQITPAVLE
jgi:hypothetical protein